jgi:hypothetical protein
MGRHVDMDNGSVATLENWINCTLGGGEVSPSAELFPTPVPAAKV